ncbi:MAG: DUF1292 domain-containing protein [Vulcanibacillus sp.]
MERKIEESNILKDYYGSQITVYDEQNNEHLFNLLLELVTDNKHYAYLQSPESKEGEIEVLEVIMSIDGEIDLEFIDDDEWEEASELFDFWTNQFD